MKRYQIRKLVRFGILLAVVTAHGQGVAATNAPASIPWSQLGANAGADYRGDGLAVTPTESGARLHCVFQRLDGETTREGLWLSSTVTNSPIDRFRVRATEVGRQPESATSDFPEPEFNDSLADVGMVSVDGQTVRFVRAGLTEEYSVSMDGVRQDFIVEQAPSGPQAGELVVKLAVTGAQVEPAACGARLVLTHSGRKIAYSRLRVTDATGKELPARIEVCPVGDEAANFATWVATGSFFEELSPLAPAPAREEMAVVVNDTEAVYPVRIDPTFSDANWVSMGGIPGANGEVNAAVVDGSGNLYIGGIFTVVANTFANYIAEWNGSTWSALGSGMSGGEYGPSVRALAVSGSTLYAAGNFTTAGGSAANYIAQWNGSSWSALGSGFSGVALAGNGTYVDALAVSGSTLYAGGGFTMAGGSPANCIAQWNGSSWSALGSGMTGGQQSGLGVLALAVSGSTVYAGGNFTAAGGNPATNIAIWNGSSWSALGSGIPGGRYEYVSALAVVDGLLCAGGEGTFEQWDGTNWSGVNSGPYGSVYALAVSGNTLYAAGYFDGPGGIYINAIATGQLIGGIWSWSALGPLLNSSVSALAVSGSTLYAGGGFTYAGGVPANYIAQWSGTSWSALGSGIGGEFHQAPYVSALAVSGSTLYVGGAFTYAGNSAVNYIAQWSGSSWSALGSGVDYLVYALAVSGSTLYAGGGFLNAGGSKANYIAAWNGSSWSALGSGMDSDVYALAVSGSTLYAGGDFTTAGGSAANYIAQWNGSSWSPLGSGISGVGDGNGPYVSALAVSGGTLYAGGDFTTAGGGAANYIAQWNGNNWSGLGSGMDNSVEALAASGSTLYAGGSFATAGGATNANYIAEWNGSSWSALGSGMNSGVYALTTTGSTLYAGGAFTNAGSNAANYIAQWNGSSWFALGSGMNDLVEALAVSGSTLYAGGWFTMAGTNVSACAAMANLAGTPVSLAIITTNTAFGFTNGVFGFDVSGPSGSNVVIQASTNLQTWIPLQTNLLGSGSLYFSNAATNRQRFYRAVLLP